MKSLVKPAVFAGFGLACAALSTDAQTPAPVQPAAPQPPALVQTIPAQAAQGGGTIYRSAAVAGDKLWYVYGDDGKALELARKIADSKTDDKEKDKLRDDLKTLLNKQFDERQKRHEKEIEQLEAQVKKLKELVSKRSENKREIIDERMKQLQKEAQGLGW